MYKEYYKLEQYPFSLTTDSEFLYWSQQHQNAYRHLLYGIQSQKSLTLLAGEVGTGKTTILHALMEFLQSQKQIQTIFLANSKISTESLFFYILSELGLHTEKNDKISCLIVLERFLFNDLDKDGKLLLILDESQNYSHDVLEEIRLLSNIETSKAKLIQIILAGQPQLLKNMSHPSMYQLKQRIGVLYNLLPLNRPETGAYIQKRLEVSGAKGRPLFHEKAIEGIYHHSTGIPRVINLLCDHALLYGYAMEQKQVTEKIVQQVAEDMALTETQLPARDFLSKNYYKKEQTQEENVYDDVILEHASSYNDRSSGKGTMEDYSTEYKYGYDGYEERFYGQRNFKGMFTKIIIVVLITVLGGFLFMKSRLSESFINLSGNNRSNTGSAVHTHSAIHKEKETILQTTPATLDVNADEKWRRNQRNDNGGESSRYNEPVSIEHNAKNERAVTVNKGDTFAKLLFSEYGEYNEGIRAFVLEANPEITDVHRIYVGQRIRLPKR